ncbi:MAG: MFS transporter [Gammaproteobacteria bacterium]|nr:MFS transporter [Gammaproteobacteria bacterium]
MSKPPALSHTLPPEHSERLYTRVTWRLIPFLFACYLCAYLDRVNVGFAKLRMAEDLAFSDTVYGLGAGIFFLGYFFFEVPSNLLLHRIGARRTLARIMVLWGLISMAMALVDDVTGFYVLRFLLGIAEAGFFPGVILYLTYWFPALRRGRVTALFVTAVAISSVIGAPLSGAIMEYFDGYGALAGWQWLFILEGLPSVLMGIATLFHLDDGPGHARWLLPAERAHLMAAVEVEQSQAGHHRVLDGLRLPAVWLLSGVYFAFVLGLYGLNFWLPTIIRELGYTDLLQIGLITALPFGVASLVMVVISRSADLRDERRWHVVIPALVGAMGLLCSVLWARQPMLAIAALTLGTCGVLSAIPQTWSIATAMLGGGAAAAGIAVINSVGNLSGFVGPYAMGWLKDATGSTDAGVLLIAGFQVVGALLVLRATGRGWRGAPRQD